MTCFMSENWNDTDKKGNVQPPPVAAEMLDGEDEDEVAQILDHHCVKSRRTYEFLVRWADYSPDHDTIRGNGSGFEECSPCVEGVRGTGQPTGG